MVGVLMNKFKKIRKEKKLTQKEFAGLLGITITALSRYENNKRHPGESRILLMTLSPEALKEARKEALKKGLL